MNIYDLTDERTSLMSQKETVRKKQSMINGALVLVIAMGITKVIGAIYKIPLTNILGTIGRSYYSTAYDLFIPVYSIALAGLPTAVSRTVSHYAALERYRDVKRVFKVGKKTFLITGIIGFAILAVIALPYTISIQKTESLYAVLMVAPSVLFCALMSAYKGYYNGLRNMTPSAVCEVIEAAIKMLAGLALSKLVLVYGMSKMGQVGATIFGYTITEATTKQDIIDACAPFSAAGAVLGVTLGTVAATLYVMLRLKIRGDGITVNELRNSPAPEEPKVLFKALMAVAVPVVANTLIFNVTNLIDTWTIQYRLLSVIENHQDTIAGIYKSALEAAGYIDDPTQWKTFLHGAYEIAVDFKNMIPTITTMLGVSVIPVLAEAWTLKRKDEIKSSIESVIRLCLMIAFPAGFGMAVLAKPILQILYGDLASNAISEKVMVAYGFTVFIIAVSQPITSMLQTIDKAKYPVKSIAVGAGLKIVVNFILIGIPQINIYGAIVGTLVCYTVSTAMNIRVLLKETGTKISLFGTCLKPFICSAFCAVSALLSYKVFLRFLSGISALEINGRINGDTISAVLAICVAAIVYIIALLVTKCIVEGDVIMLPKGKKIAEIMDKMGVLGK